MCGLLAACATVQSAPPDADAEDGALRLYVGTYTSSGASTGIYRLRLDLATGALAEEGPPTETGDPSWVALHPSGRFLYAVNETGAGPDDPSGGVSAFAVDASTGALTLLNRQPSGGPAPCHLAFDRSGRYLLVANYWGGSVAVLPLAPDGRLGAASAVMRHGGGTRAPGRDPGPHAHAVQLSPDNRFALVADLGRDEVMVYRFDAAAGTLTPQPPPALSLGEGSGPRHLVFDRDGRHLFVIDELSSEIDVLAYDAEAGSLSPLQTISTLPAGWQGSNSTAEIALSPDGRFLYGSNRGHDSIAIFAVDAATRTLTALGHQPTLGKRPRHFALDPSGRWLLAANQDSDSIVVFRVDATTGALMPVGTPFRVPRPVSLEFAAAGG
jgi:6-phosphogluconolactonase